MLVKAGAVRRIEIILVAWHEHRSIPVVNQAEDVVIKRVRVVQSDVLDVTHPTIVQLPTELLHVGPATEVCVYLVIVLNPVTVISRAVTGSALVHPNVLGKRRHPDGGSAEALEVT